MKKIGLVGGVSWTSTSEYYKFINEEINRVLGGLNFAEMIVYSLNFGEVQKRTWAHSFELLLHACESLKRSGAEVIILGANTAHLFADEIQAKIQLPIIHIATVTAMAIEKKGLEKVGLLGTKFTMEMDFYREKLSQNGLEVIIPERQNDRDFIHHVVKEELGRGVINGQSRKKFITISDELMQQGAQGVILGCTEIPLLIGQDDVSIPIFDTTKIHSHAVVEYALTR
jgi:aspartate racemase